MDLLGVRKAEALIKRMETIEGDLKHLVRDKDKYKFSKLSLELEKVEKAAYPHSVSIYLFENALSDELKENIMEYVKHVLEAQIEQCKHQLLELGVTLDDGKTKEPEVVSE